VAKSVKAPLAAWIACAGALVGLALVAYDRMTEAGAAGAEYETRIFPPPGHGPRRQTVSPLEEARIVHSDIHE